MDTIKRTYILNVLKESENDLLSVTEQVNEAGFMFKADEQTWSMAEIVEHLVLLDSGLLQSIKKKGENIKDTTPETLSNEKILKLTPRRETKIPAPEHFVPKGRFKSKTQAIEAFRQSRSVIENFVETTDLPLERIAFKHFLLGLINGEGWIVFMAGHCNRHIAQMKETKDAFETK